MTNDENMKVEEAVQAEEIKTIRTKNPLTPFAVKIIMKATHRIMDTVWSITFYPIFNEQYEIVGIELLTCTPHDYPAAHQEGVLPIYNIIEDEKRHVTHIQLAKYRQFTEDAVWSPAIPVVNSRRIFSYTTKVVTAHLVSVPIEI